MARRASNAKRGFTLVELMITVAIVGILSSIAIPLFMLNQLRARTTEAYTNLADIRRGITGFRAAYDFNIAIEPEPCAGSVGCSDGQKHEWPPQAARSRAFLELNGYGTFRNIEFEPAGWVYYSYCCYADSQEVTCEAAADLDLDGLGGYVQLAWEDPSPNTFGFAGYGFFSGLTPRVYGEPHRLNPGRF